MKNVNAWMAIAVGLLSWPVAITTIEWVYCRTSGEEDCSRSMSDAIAAPGAAVAFIVGRCLPRREEDAMTASDHEAILGKVKIDLPTQPIPGNDL